MNPLRHIKRKRRRQAVTGGTTRLTAKLKVPPELVNGSQHIDEGIIRPQTGKLHLSSDLLDSGAGAPEERTDRVVIVVVGLALVFIGFIVWYIAHH
ncbi:MAG: hypothetical protein U0Z53_11610 [Blastocatellia bacterium]